MDALTLDPSSSLQKLKTLCEQRDWRVALAESCTGGLLSSWLTAQPGVSNFFIGSVVSYARSVKENILQVPGPVLAAQGEVSVAVAQFMARGVRQQLQSTWSAAITGIAGPGGGSVDKPVGTVCFAVSGPGFEKACLQHFDSKQSRVDIQRQAALFALDFLLDAMK